MAEVRNIKHAGWYASWMNDDQGKCLIRFLVKRVEQLENVLETIGGECELLDEYQPEMIFESIKTLTKQVPHTEHIEGYFKWTTEEVNK